MKNEDREMIGEYVQIGENTIIQTIRGQKAEVEKREDFGETADPLWIVKLS